MARAGPAWVFPRSSVYVGLSGFLGLLIVGVGLSLALLPAFGTPFSPTGLPCLALI